jgi:periplasmic protein TonB
MLAVQVTTTLHGEEHMLGTLLESNAIRARRTGGTLASTLVHAALFAGAIVVTARGPGVKPVDPEIVLPPFVVGRPPEAPPAGRAYPPSSSTPTVPTAPRLPSVDRVPDDIPPIDVDVKIPVGSDDEVARGTGPLVQSPGSAGGGVGERTPDGALDERYVDRAPRIVGNPIQPDFPASLRERGVSGRVSVQFVVDTLGRAEMSGLRVVEATDPRFAQSVRAVLGRYRFSPGEVGGRKVRTLVQLPFDFTLVR